ncbi:Ubiquitin-like protein [Mactra antiquata]
MSTEQGNESKTEATAVGRDDTAGTSAEMKEPTSPTVNKLKVDVLLKPAGDAPIMKKKKWAVERHKKVAYIADFIKKFIKMDMGESLFLYVNQSFSPALDTEVGCVYDCFGSDGKLVLHYCKSQAWG